MERYPNILNLRPIKRSSLRNFLGKKYYTLKRYITWTFGTATFAHKFNYSPFLHLVKEHKTPLYRNLRNVDMWLQHNKVINLKLAVERLNGIVFYPNETFSYWKLIGKPTKRKGYIEGMVLFYGGFRPGIGGGLCQLSNLIYWLTLHTPLTIIERHRHSYDAFPDENRKQPFGSGATCSYNYLDLQIVNKTDQPFQLLLHLTDTHLVGEWRCAVPSTCTYEVYEKDHQISPAYWGGYFRQNIIHRRVFNLQGKQIDDEFITENYALMMYEPLINDTNS